jgi:Carboxypeptidase regulatory-like domain
MRPLRIVGGLLLAVVSGVMPGRMICAQSPGVLSSGGTQSQGAAPVPQGDASGESVKSDGVKSELPDSPGQKIADGRAKGNVVGSVLDANGAEVEGAVVKVENEDSKAQQTSTTDGSGAFQFSAVEPGRLRVTVTAQGFAGWVSSGVVLHPGENLELPEVDLKVASAMTDVEVTLTQHDVAEDQLRAQEKQRVLGVIPNFWVSYVWNAAPLSSGQKFRLAFRSAIDPVSFLSAAFSAGLEQSENEFSGYGQGAKGYFLRMSAFYGDGFTSAFLGGAILPSILHQDPRYFYKGKGSIRSRALYAMAAIAICKGDNGKWQPNYSNVLGNLASAGISNTYYPAGNRGGGLVVENWLIGTGSGAIGNLFQEFLVKKISRGVPKATIHP